MEIAFKAKDSFPQILNTQNQSFICLLVDFLRTFSACGEDKEAFV